MKELTARQQEIYNFIVQFIADRGYPPTIMEIMQAFNIASTNGVRRHLVALEKKRYTEQEDRHHTIRRRVYRTIGAVGKPICCRQKWYTPKSCHGDVLLNLVKAAHDRRERKATVNQALSQFGTILDRP